jgi:lysophospholipase L1-like esterase
LEAPPDGAGNPESQYAFWMLKLRPDCVVFNCGVNGEESGDILRRLPRDVLRRRPDFAVILAGVNDVYRGRTVPSVQSNLSAMYSRTRAEGIRVVAASILPYNSMSPQHADAMDTLNRWVERVAKESGLTFCDTHALVSDARNPNRLAGSPDGLHPDVSSYRRMGEGLVRAIEEAIRV